MVGTLLYLYVYNPVMGIRGVSVYACSLLCNTWPRITKLLCKFHFKLSSAAGGKQKREDLEQKIGVSIGRSTAVHSRLAHELARAACVAEQSSAAKQIAWQPTTANVSRRTGCGKAAAAGA